MATLFTRRDRINAAIIGALAGLLAWYVLAAAQISSPLIQAALPWLWLVLAIAAPIGLWIAARLARRLSWLYQFSKYGLIGVVNTLTSFTLLNFFAQLTGITKGLWVGVFVVVAFTVASTNSFFWNKYWTFNATTQEQTKVQYLQFILVTAISAVLAAALVAGLTHYVASPFGISKIAEQQWLNVANIFGTVVALLWNFVAYKFVVFDTKRS